VVTSFVLHKLSPETVIVSGDKSTLIMRPVFGEYYKQSQFKPNLNWCCTVDGFENFSYCTEQT
jgi:hypothetical protein